MIRRAALPLLAVCLSLVGGPWGFAEEVPAGRTLTCRVVDEGGRPVPGVQVYLCGLDRGTPAAEDVMESPTYHPRWIFKTDQRGRFAVAFGKFNPYPHELTGEYAGPGYGFFHFVVSKPGAAGGVSRVIINVEDPASYQPPAKRKPGADAFDDEEWQRGEFAPLVLTEQVRSKPLVIVLKRGLDLHGQMVDRQGHPLSGQPVEVSLDLHYGSHTGAGGEIFGQHTTTNHAGRFRFRHVYPNVFRIRPEWSKPPVYWTKTQVRNQWHDRIVDEIIPRTGSGQNPTNCERSLDVRLVVSKELPYRYFGRVVDEQGVGVSGERVYVETSWHEPARTYGDYHGGEEALTDPQGNYSVLANTRFANGIYVNTESVIGEVNAHGDVLLPPGRYNFVVRPKKAGE